MVFKKKNINFFLIQVNGLKFKSLLIMKLKQTIDLKNKDTIIIYI